LNKIHNEKERLQNKLLSLLYQNIFKNVKQVERLVPKYNPELDIEMLNKQDGYLLDIQEIISRKTTELDNKFID